MATTFDIWELLAGIALFLFAMTQLEAALKALGGRSLARYLQRQTRKRLNAVLSGIVATALLQSSSVVGLMVLAFTGAGLLTLPSALGIIFGSNLGTTFTGWIVATIGFKFEIFRVALPLITIGGGVFLFGRNRWIEGGRGVLSLGLLLLALQFMKSNVAGIEQYIDMGTLADFSSWQYLLFGIIVAAVIQSSSATMMLTLTALSVDIISLPSAAAIAIGADLGTTTTVLLGALKGSAEKKRVALGHFFFNLVTDLFAFVIRMPLLQFIAMIGVVDSLYSLVAFHSLFNVVGLVIFVPLTRVFAGWLVRLVPPEDIRTARYLSEVNPALGAAALPALNNEASGLIGRAVRLAGDVFETPIIVRNGRLPVKHKRGVRADAAAGFEHLYLVSKMIEGQILGFAVRLQAGRLDAAASARLGQLMTACRRAMRSAKSIKNVRHNLLEFAGSGSPAADEYLARFHDSMHDYLRDVYALRPHAEKSVAFEDLAALLTRQQQRHDAIHATIFNDVRSGRIDESLVSTLLNVNREMLNCQVWLLLALGDFHLSPSQADDLEQMPPSA